MKFRSDFVTNSSSSSYIFKSPAPTKQGLSEMRRRLETLIEAQGSGGWKREDESLEFLRQDLNYVVSEIRSFADHSFADLYETFEWYSLDIMRSRIQDFREDRRFEERPGEPVLLDDEVLRVLLSAWLMERLALDHWYEDSPDLKKLRYSEEELKERLFALLSGEDAAADASCPYLSPYLADNSEGAFRLLPEFADRTPDQLMAILFDADRMYFDGESMEPALDEAIRSSAECLYGCDHMG